MSTSAEVVPAIGAAPIATREATVRWGLFLPVVAAVVGAVLPIAILPNEQAATFDPKYAIMLVLAAVGTVRLGALAVRSRYSAPARIGLALLTVCLVSSAVSQSPLVGIFGLYQWGEGTLFFAALMGSWAIGVSLDETGRRWLVNGLLVGVAANAVVAVAQVVFSLNSQLADQSGFGLYQGTQADGMMGNPIHLEALLLGGLALVLTRACRKPWPWLVLVALFSVALELSSERLGAILLLGLVAYALVQHRTRGIAFAASAVGGFALPLVAHSGVTLANRVASSTASSTFTLRLNASWIGVKATLLHSPLLGFGPGEVRNPVSRYASMDFERRLQPGRYFTDLHDLFANVMTMTGLLGLGLFVAFLVIVGRRARGPLLGMTILMLSVELVEPMNLAVTPLAFLALGAAVAGTAGHAELVPLARAGLPRRQSAGAMDLAAPGGGRRTGVPKQGIALVGAVVLGIIPAAVLLVGDGLAAQGLTPFTLQKESLASELVPIWPVDYMNTALIYRYEGTVDPSQKRADLVLARHETATAVARDPSDNTLWQQLALADIELGDLAAARSDLQRSLQLDPYAVATLLTLGEVDGYQKQWSAAISTLTLAQSLAPGNPVIGQAIQRARRHESTTFQFSTS